jgi:hypothetical protein
VLSKPTGTLRADGASLAEVLRAIGAAGAFEVVLRGTFATPVHEAFAERPLEDAIRGLLAGHSVVFLRADPDPAFGAGALAEIRVIENPAPASEDPGLDAPSTDATQAAEDDPTDEPPMDRETFRLAKLGVRPPTREDILLELGDPDPALGLAAAQALAAWPQED